MTCIDRNPSAPVDSTTATNVTDTEAEAVSSSVLAGLPFLVIAFLLTTASARSATAQHAEPFICGHDSANDIEKYEANFADASSSPDIPTSGAFRAMLIYVRFPDETYESTSCVPAAQSWPLGDPLPSIAEHVLVASQQNGEPPLPPFPEATLTEYFYRQSQGRFTLYGDVFAVEASYDESHYPITDFGGRNILTKDVLDQLDSDPTVDFSQYDQNGDGYVDHIFMVVRRFRKDCPDPNSPTDDCCVGCHDPYWGGVADLGSGTSELVYNNKKVSWRRSGSYIQYFKGNTVPSLGHIRVLAHEFGHDLWSSTITNGAHIKPVGGTHGVPANGSNRVGYLLMAGQGVGDDKRGDEAISAFERDILDDGWISCYALGVDGTYTITDLVSDSAANCYTMSVPNESSPRTIYLSNRQRIHHFDHLESTCIEDRGLKTTGLLVQVSQGNRLAVAAADNTLDLAIRASDYFGDLFGPTTTSQLTPWTRPNISGFTTYSAGFTMEAGNWQAIDDIQYTGGSNGEITFDYIDDFTVDPIIRADSWIGIETVNKQLNGELQVESGATLTVTRIPGNRSRLTPEGHVTIRGILYYDLSSASASTITIGGNFSVESGGSATLLATNKVVFEPGFSAAFGSSLHAEVVPQITMVEGELEPEHDLLVLEEAPQANQDQEHEDGRQVAVEGVLETSVYPNPFNPQSTLSFTLARPAFVRLVVYDVLGRQVAALVEGQREAGRWEVRFDASHLASGVYLYRLEANDESGEQFIQTRRMTLLK